MLLHSETKKDKNCVMCDVIKILKILFLGVSFSTSPLIAPFKTYFYDVTHDTFKRFESNLYDTFMYAHASMRS